MSTGKKKRKLGVSGLTGIYPRGKRWAARLKGVHLGTFATVEAALAARRKALAATRLEADRRALAETKRVERPQPERRPLGESGHPDVTWDRFRKRWKANGTGVSHGRYLTVAEAIEAVESHKRANRGLPVVAPECVRRTNRKGGHEDLTLAIAAARLKGSGRFATLAEAEAALLSGEAVATTFGTYELIGQSSSLT